MSHPMWVRGLKLLNICITICHLRSHPMWVRGLKQTVLRKGSCSRPSHPMWVRGLKRSSSLAPALGATVAPYVGAWIETPYLMNMDAR